MARLEVAELAVPQTRKGRVEPIPGIGLRGEKLLTAERVQAQHANRNGGDSPPASLPGRTRDPHDGVPDVRRGQTGFIFMVIF
jgi:hypothetical protein